MIVDVFTLFPEWFDWLELPRHLANASVSDGLTVRCFSYRDHTPLSQGQVDDAPYGGGPGMVLRPDVVAVALGAVYGGDPAGVRDTRRVIALTPRGRQFTDAVARELADSDGFTLLCGRYEGFDERIHDALANDAICLGPFVLSGGEIAAMAIIDAVARRVPGALGNPESLEHESFGDALEGRTEHPHYTRPASFLGIDVPSVLRSGDHAAIARWRTEHTGRPAPRRGGATG